MKKQMVKILAILLISSTLLGTTAFAADKGNVIPSKKNDTTQETKPATATAPVTAITYGSLPNAITRTAASDAKYIYYTGFLNQYLYRTTKDGKNKIEMLHTDNAPIVNLNTANGYLYYTVASWMRNGSTEDNDLFRMKPDGTEKTVIATFRKIEDVIIANNKIYAIVDDTYDIYSKDFSLYTMDLSGKNKTKLKSLNSLEGKFSANGNTVYLLDAAKEDSSIYAINTSNNSVSTVAKDFNLKGKLSGLRMNGKTPYFVYESEPLKPLEFWTVSETGKASKVKNKEFTTDGYLFYNGMMYYHTNDDYAIYRKKIGEAGKGTKLTTYPVHEKFTIVDSFLYVQPHSSIVEERLVPLPKN